VTEPVDPFAPGGAPPTIVKLGGSVITRKREAARLRPKLLARLAGELAGAPRGSLLLLHGAGSFGHPGARRWRLNEPPAGAGERERTRGAAIVAAEVRRLHLAVLRALLDAGIDAWSVPAATLVRQRAGRLEALPSEPFGSALARGAVPVSFGDVVPDLAWGFSILSADTMAVELARSLGARRVLFVSDVDGALRPPTPGRGRRSVYPRLTPEIVRELLPTPGAPDVTGGIRGKLAAMLALADAGVDAGLISGLRHGALSRALRGDTVYGSWSGPGAPDPGAPPSAP
jgi:isopentenyl phosphate kinase